MPEGHDARDDERHPSRPPARRRREADPDDERNMEPADRYLWYLVPFAAVWVAAIAAAVVYYV